MVALHFRLQWKKKVGGASGLRVWPRYSRRWNQEWLLRQKLRKYEVADVAVFEVEVAERIGMQEQLWYRMW